MSNDKDIAKILNVVRYYVDNHMYRIEGNWHLMKKGSEEEISTECDSFKVNSFEGYTIIISKDYVVKITLSDIYGRVEVYFTDNYIFCLFVNDTIKKITTDSKLTLLERVGIENRNINLNKIK